MDQHHYQRIDKGVKRKKIDRKPKNLKDQETGQFVALVPDETRKAVIDEAINAIQQGENSHQAMDALGKKYGVSGRTVRTWLLADDRAEKARGLLISSELARTLDEMRAAKDASSPLPLACAREEFRAWSWMAERRESRLYGQKQEVTHVVTDLGDRLRRAREREIPGEYAVVQQTPQAIDSNSDAAQHSESKNA
jgi:hypothetical protein